MTAQRALAPPTAVTLADFDRWVAGAEPGDVLVYAKGDWPPHGAAAWVHARTLVEDGVVTLTTRRAATGDAGRWDYLAVRVRTAEPAAPASAPTVDEANATDLVLRELRRAANMGAPCPTNDMIARRCGLKDAAAASYRVRQLVAARRIEIESQGPNAPRIVTILGTGKSTARDGSRS